MRKYALIATLFAIGSLPGCDKPASSDSAPVANSSSATSHSSADTNAAKLSIPEAQLHNFGDFSFAIPDGWQVAPEEPGKTKAKLFKLDAEGREVAGLVMVDVGKPATPDVKALAESLAKGSGGTVATDTLIVGGETGYHFTTPSTTMQAPQAGVVLLRNSKCYMVMGAANAGVDVRSALTQIQNSWRWTDSSAN